uniref:Ig-like domain-containing protein n=1 Tax=Apteryx owenii TaxID=8824 RepID=A0A8B9QGW3_APTOW
MQALSRVSPAEIWPGCPAQSGRWTPVCPRPPVSGQICCFTELHRRELDSLSVQCPYNAQMDSTTKAWCRREGHTSCNIVVSTNYPSTRRYSTAQQNRTSIWDNTWDKTVTITMEKLQEQDSGVYRCLLYTHARRTQIMEVRLTVSKSDRCPSGSDMQYIYRSPVEAGNLQDLLQEQRTGRNFIKFLLSRIILPQTLKHLSTIRSISCPQCCEAPLHLCRNGLSPVSAVALFSFAALCCNFSSSSQPIHQCSWRNPACLLPELFFLFSLHFSKLKASCCGFLHSRRRPECRQDFMGELKLTRGLDSDIITTLALLEILHMIHSLPLSSNHLVSDVK